MDPGTVIAGRYRLEARIGAGGMGAVWRASDRRLDREVAVKILHPLFDQDQQPVARFEREAKILAGFSGPGFVGVHDFGVEEHDGAEVWFIAMELVETGSLSALLERRGRLSAEESMRLAAQAAEALGKAHRRGVVHRDIKPGNLLIDADGQVRIVDFGISLLTERSRLTAHSAVLGTSSYIAPEHFGDDELTGAADLYALGVVAYECLTGAPPFTGSRKESVIRGHLYDEPPPLPDDVPPAVAAVVMRSLRKRPAERWDSGAAMAAACVDAIESPAPGLAAVVRPDATTAPDPVAAPTVESAASADVAEAADTAGAAPADPADAPETTHDHTIRLKRRRRPRPLLVLAAALVLLAGLGLGTVLIPWGEAAIVSGDDTTDDGGTATPTPTASGTGEPSPTDDDEAADPGPGGAGSSDDGDTGGSEAEGGDGDSASSGGSDGGSDGDDGGGDTGPDPPADTRITVPDLYHVPVAEAQARLHDLGFDNVEPQSTTTKDGDGSLDGCDVVAQSPGGGAKAEPNATITLTYFAFVTHLCW